MNKELNCRNKWIRLFEYINENVSIYKKLYNLVMSWCLFVCLSDHISETPWPICLKFGSEKSGEPRGWSLVGFEILSWMGQLYQGEK